MREADGELAGLVGEALELQRVARDEWGRQRLRHLDGRAVLERRCGLRWEEYVGGGERRLAAGERVWSVAVDLGHVCGGLSDGSVGVWSRSTLEQERTLTGHRDAVLALLFVGGRLVSGSDDRSIRVWDVAAGRCEGVLEGHTGVVTSLAVSGSRLLSGSCDRDGTVRVWGMEGEASSWLCERTLDGQGSGVWCLAAWGERVACGVLDGDIGVWSLETWGSERTLKGHILCVSALVVSGGRLISSSADGTVRVWSCHDSCETWECVQTVETVVLPGRVSTLGPWLCVARRWWAGQWEAQRRRSGRCGCGTWRRCGRCTR